MYRIRFLMQFNREAKMMSAKQNEHTRNTLDSAWDIVLLSFKIMFKRIHFWIRPNIWYLLFSLPIITNPGAKAALIYSVSEGLRDPEFSTVVLRETMKDGFKKYFRPALALSLMKNAGLLVIAFSIYFWISQEDLIFRIISILAIYGLVVWWLASAYIYPVLIENPSLPALEIFKKSFLLSARNPFKALLFSIIDLLLSIFSLILFGPIMLIAPALRAILCVHSYWHLTGQVIPGFMDVFDYYTNYKKEVI